ncbi:MAG: PAS domain S-box protein [Methylobacter sp.]|nr:PAS domain S-box protein [Methylobacter sp.]
MNGKFFSSNTDQQPWLIIRQFLLIWMLLTLALAAAFWSVYKTQEKSTLAFIGDEERQAIKLGSQFVAEELRMVHDDLFYLRDQPVLHDWLEKESPHNLDRLNADLLAFVKYRELYDRILFLDENGRERVRIDRNRGQSVIMSARELEDKSNLYFVEQTLTLNKDFIYISPFDLAIEHNKIEQPIKPVIRFGTPVYDQHGQKRGIILLGYRGQRLIDRLRAISRQSIGSLWLLNAKGYWLIGARPEDEWSFMYPGRKNRLFADDYGEAWSSIIEHPERLQFMINGDLFTYGEILPKALFGDIREGVVSGDERWLLVARVPAEKFFAKNVMQTRLLAFLALSLLLGIASWFIAHYRVRRRQTEEEVSASEARFRGLLESAPDAIVIVDGAGNIVLVNAQTEKWFGYSRDELLGQPVELLIPERFRMHHQSYRQAYTDNPVVRPMGVGLELYARCKDGSDFPVEINLSPLKIERELFIISIIRNITARKQSEQAKREAQTKYQELVNNLRVGVYRHALASGCFLEVNPAIIAMFEAESAEQLQAYPVNDLCRDPGCWRVFMDKISRQGFADNEEMPLVTLKGREFTASVTAAMKKDSAGNTYYDGIIEDISERKETERRIQQLNTALRDRAMALESVNHELEAFSYSVSHDLRAPLRAVDGFSRILLDEYAEQLDDKGRDRLKRVRAAAQRMAMLIDDLLKLSRITRSELKREDIDLGALAGEAIEELRRQEPERVIQCTIQPDLIAWGDVRLLRIVLDNLLGNAWKFTGKRPDAQIEFGMHRQDDGEPVYFVRDNGAGFDMAYAEKLFGAFQRLHETSEFPGTGIGLATAQRIIHKHGGRIWAEGEVGQGATFYFTLEARENL